MKFANRTSSENDCCSRSWIFKANIAYAGVLLLASSMAPTKILCETSLREVPLLPSSLPFAAWKENIPPPFFLFLHGLALSGPEGSSVDISRREGGGLERKGGFPPPLSVAACLRGRIELGHAERGRGGGYFPSMQQRERGGKKGNFSEGGLTENFIGAIELAESKTPAYAIFPLNIHENNSHFHCLSCWQISRSFPFAKLSFLAAAGKGEVEEKKRSLCASF